MDQDLTTTDSETTTNQDDAPAALNAGPKVITLVAQDSAGERKAYRLHKERVVIGSVVSADVRLAGEGVAPIHAVVELSDGSATIYDLASDTGIFINNQRTVTQALKNADKIRIGKYELQFSVEDLSDLLPKQRTRETEGRKLFLDPEEDFSPLLLEDERQVVQIFDYRAAEKRALQVVMSWRGTVLDVEHFVGEKKVTLGTTRKSDFGIPPILSNSKEFDLITRQGNSFILNIDPKMGGVLQRKGRLDSLDELRSSGGVALTEDDFAKVTVGEIDFYLSHTAGPPRLKMGRLFDRDPLFFRFFTGSLAMTAAIIAAAIQIDMPQQLEAEQIPERIATILYQPEKYVEKPKIPIVKSEPVETKPVEKPPVEKPKPPEEKKIVKLEIQPKPMQTPKPVPKEMHVAQKPTPVKPAKSAATENKTKGQSHAQNEAKEGEGARAKGKEGSRGSKKAPVVNGAASQSKAMRPSPMGGKGAGSGNSQVKDEGNVDILKDATGKIQDILGNSAAQLGKGGEKLKGFGGFTTQGNGGLALSGDGSGGGGNADTSLGGLGNKGRGGGRVGTGLGAAGNGNGIIGGKTRVAIRTGGPEEAVVMGSIDADAVEAALLAHKDEFRLCYEKEVNAENPDLAGRVGTTFVIGSTGRVTQAGIASTTLKNANVERCILNVIRRIDFPIPRGAGLVQVSYPFKYNPTGK